MDDLATLQELTEAALLSNLKARYDNDQIYVIYTVCSGSADDVQTYVGDILLAVNPYKQLACYGPEVHDTSLPC